MDWKLLGQEAIQMGSATMMVFKAYKIPLDYGQIEGVLCYGPPKERLEQLHMHR
jgi:hypothetical protein